MKRTLHRIIISVCFTLCAVMLCGCAVLPATTDADTPVAENIFKSDGTTIMAALTAEARSLCDECDAQMSEITLYESAVGADSCSDILGYEADEFSRKAVYAIESKATESYVVHSVVLVKLTDGTDARATAEYILANTAPGRFGCLPAICVRAIYCEGYITVVFSSEEICDAFCRAFEILSPSEAHEVKN